MKKDKALVVSAISGEITSDKTNATDFAIGIQKAINGEDAEGYTWFLN